MHISLPKYKHFVGINMAASTWYRCYHKPSKLASLVWLQEAVVTADRRWWIAIIGMLLQLKIEAFLDNEWDPIVNKEMMKMMVDADE
jgi:hypothetical protein